MERAVKRRRETLVEAYILVLPRDVLAHVFKLLANERPRSRWGVYATVRLVCKVFRNAVPVWLLQQGMRQDIADFPLLSVCMQHFEKPAHDLDSRCMVHPSVAPRIRTDFFGNPFRAPGEQFILKVQRGQEQETWHDIYRVLNTFAAAGSPGYFAPMWYAMSSSYHIYMRLFN